VMITTNADTGAVRAPADAGFVGAFTVLNG
jgi:hypothetical protein